MTGFILIAATLTVVATGLVVIPLVRKPQARAPWAALSAAGILIGGATALYLSLSDWSWRAPAPATTPEAMVAQLARRLERNPQDLRGWLMLGRSYTVLEQFALAARAYQRADRLAEGKSPDALVGLAEALALGDESQLDGRAGRLFEQALELDPNSGKALFYGAVAALRRGELPVARERFARLLALDPPANVKQILEGQIAAIDQRLAGPQPVS
jgi:cytochrome c-type biogenesis protein CcmH